MKTITDFDSFISSMDKIQKIYSTMYNQNLKKGKIITNDVTKKDLFKSVDNNNTLDNN